MNDVFFVYCVLPCDRVHSHTPVSNSRFQSLLNKLEHRIPIRVKCIQAKGSGLIVLETQDSDQAYVCLCHRITAEVKSARVTGLRYTGIQITIKSD